MGARVVERFSDDANMKFCCSITFSKELPGLPKFNFSHLEPLIWFFFHTIRE